MPPEAKRRTWGRSRPCTSQSVQPRIPFSDALASASSQASALLRHAPSAIGPAPARASGLTAASRRIASRHRHGATCHRRPTVFYLVVDLSRVAGQKRARCTPARHSVVQCHGPSLHLGSSAGRLAAIEASAPELEAAPPPVSAAPLPRVRPSAREFQDACVRASSRLRPPLSFSREKRPCHPSRRGTLDQTGFRLQTR